MNSYPPLGIPQIGIALPDRIVLFLMTVRQTCCGLGNHKPCAQCDDALRLHDEYKTSLGVER